MFRGGIEKRERMGAKRKEGGERGERQREVGMRRKTSGRKEEERE